MVGEPTGLLDLSRSHADGEMDPQAPASSPVN
jgi:hypothetical protein